MRNANTERGGVGNTRDPSALCHRTAANPNAKTESSEIPLGKRGIIGVNRTVAKRGKRGAYLFRIQDRGEKNVPPIQHNTCIMTHAQANFGKAGEKIALPFCHSADFPRNRRRKNRQKPRKFFLHTLSIPHKAPKYGSR